MGLPTLSAPTYKTVVPSTGQRIQFRPFLVKEEKLLLMALEGGDPKEMAQATKDMLASCIITKGVDVNKLATFDIEYLLLKIRGKSVGEVIDLQLGHTGDNDCKARTEVSIKIDDIRVSGVKKDKNVMLTDKIGVTVHYPTVSDAETFITNEADSTFKMLAACIDVVFDEDNVYEDFTADELIDWLGGLSQKQFEKIADYFNDLPTMSHTVSWTCKECGQKDSFTIEGLHSFFTLL